MTGGSSSCEAIGFMHEVNSHHLSGALPQPMAAGDGPSIGGNIEQGGLLLDCFKLNVSEGSSSTQAFRSVKGLGSLPQATADGEGPEEKSSKKLAPSFFP
ncbi:hypothetical protein Ddye_032063 [Dipteronia dyeriana]|uniref:Uncharacterized protein n=1 Tax=Dipteronia dyeriana TaxID=168575 RepID=A0AAD9TJQ3_9ROSI|nr:hypothetical protein Ddye_032063 [Dipteronia dyeriana]